MNSVLLINPPYYTTDDNRRIPHIGLLYLQASLKKNGFECDIIDAAASDADFSVADILRKAQKKRYLFFGITVLYSTEKIAIEIAELLKKNIPGCIIALGGIHATIEHERLIQTYKCIDIIMRGDGENTIVQLAKCLVDKYPTTLYGCTIRKSDGNIVYANEIVHIDDLDKLPFPLHENFSTKAAKKFLNDNANNYVPVSSSRGCVYKCSFCCIPCTNSKWRARSAENVIEEILKISQTVQNPFVVFVDDNFLLDKERALDIARGIREQCHTIIPFSFATRADQIVYAGEELMTELKLCGCVTVEVGIENGCTSVLERMNKKITSDTNLRALNVLRKSGIIASVDYILFEPQISIDELKTNISFFKESGLWGYYPPRIYNRIFPYTGAAVCKEITDMNHYFANDEVNMIYTQLIKFKQIVQPQITKKIFDETLSLAEKMWLRMVPYIFLEKIVYGKKDDASCVKYCEDLLKKYDIKIQKE